MPWFVSGCFFLHSEGSSVILSLFPRRVSVGPQCLLSNFSITVFISGVQKRMQYLGNNHHSVSIRTLTVEGLLKSLCFLGKKEIFPAVLSPQKQWVSWIIRKELPEEHALKNNCLQRSLAYQQMKKEKKKNFSPKF